MTREDFDNIVERRLNLTRKVLVSKGKEYSKDTNVFHNFDAAAGLSFHSIPEKVGWEFMVKHLQSIKDILDHVETGGYNGYPTEELVEEKFGDAINYLILIEGMLKGRIKQGSEKQL